MDSHLHMVPLLALCLRKNEEESNDYDLIPALSTNERSARYNLRPPQTE
jgi:hypothetical protein